MGSTQWYFTKFLKLTAAAWRSSTGESRETSCKSSVMSLACYLIPKHYSLGD